MKRVDVAGDLPLAAEVHAEPALREEQHCPTDVAHDIFENALWVDALAKVPVVENGPCAPPADDRRAICHW